MELAVTCHTELPCIREGKELFVLCLAVAGTYCPFYALITRLICLLIFLSQQGIHTSVKETCVLMSYDSAIMSPVKIEFQSLRGISAM